MDLTGVFGGIAGLIGGAVNGFIEIKKHKVETERLREQWAHERDFAKIRSDALTEEQNAEAFKESIKSSQCEELHYPPNATQGQIWWITVTQSLRTATRPLLTWTLVAAAVHNPAMADMASMAVGWWFGSRTTTKFFSK